jgi:transposase
VESGPRAEKLQSDRPSHRKPLPDHLPREDVRLDIDDMTFKGCGGALHLVGDSVGELDWVPAQICVIRTTCPKYACRICETVAQAPRSRKLRNGTDLTARRHEARLIVPLANATIYAQLAGARTRKLIGEALRL